MCNRVRNLLRVIVDDFKFSFSELSKILGVSQSTVWYWYRGVKAPRDPENVLFYLEKLIEANGLRVEELYFKEDSMYNSPFTFKTLRYIDELSKKGKLLSKKSDLKKLKKIVYGRRSIIVNQARSKLTCYAGSLGIINNKQFMNACGILILKAYNDGKLKKKNIDSMVLAIMRIVSLKQRMNIEIDPSSFGVEESDYREALKLLVDYL